MSTKEKIERLKNFQSEKEFREFLIDLLKKMGFTEVYHTHRFGNPELGKDIIAKLEHTVDGSEIHAFVVKLGHIGGGSTEIETIKNQIKQSFEYPYTLPNGEAIKVNKVKVVTNENITYGAQGSLTASPELRIYNNFNFWWNESLISLIDKHYPDYWLPGDAFVKEYSTSFIKSVKSDFELRELALKKIDSNKLNKLLNLFIEPKVTEDKFQEDPITKEKKPFHKIIHLNQLTVLNDNAVILGDQGSGKTKLLNNIACQMAEVETISQNHKLPVRLKAPIIRDISYDIEALIKIELQNHAGDFYTEAITENYTLTILVDDLDLLSRDEKGQLIAALKKYCNDSNSNYILTYRRNDFHYDADVRTLKIHNFNLRQIENFVSNFFDGVDKAKRFIDVLKDSNILSKLPTTPLTITLISLLYDENNYEIPATLSDIYNDFVGVLLGKLDIRDRQQLLMLNIKRRIFTSFALYMLVNKKFEVSFEEFELNINTFLKERGYQEQTSDELEEIIEQSGLLYHDDYNNVGFKQQAFVEFLASLEIYHHQREKYYSVLLDRFNDINWQNTAIFYAGHSKELNGMIDDVINRAPNENLSDWLITSAGMGYLSQALYQTRPAERKKLVLKSLDNIVKSFYALKNQSEDPQSFIYRAPLPLIGGMVAYWFSENFKSITLGQTLQLSFQDIEKMSPDQDSSEFDNNFRLLMIAATLMHSYIGIEEPMSRLLERKSFSKQALLQVLAEMSLNNDLVNSKILNPDYRDKLIKSLRKKESIIKAFFTKPAYQFDSNFVLEDKKHEATPKSLEE
ncbi:MAG: hypothetical protein U0T75_06555 [Chitinophagales bacterium]